MKWWSSSSSYFSSNWCRFQTQSTATLIPPSMGKTSKRTCWSSSRKSLFLILSTTWARSSLPHCKRSYASPFLRSSTRSSRISHPSRFSSQVRRNSSKDGSYMPKWMKERKDGSSFALRGHPNLELNCRSKDKMEPRKWSTTSTKSASMWTILLVSTSAKNKITLWVRMLARIRSISKNRLSTPLPWRTLIESYCILSENTLVTFLITLIMHLLTRFSCKLLRIVVPFTLRSSINTISSNSLPS